MSTKLIINFLYLFLEDGNSASDLISAMNVWVQILSTLLTIALASIGFLSYIQYRKGKESTDKLINDTEERIKKMISDYQLSKMKPPEEIKDEIRNEFKRDYDERIESIRKNIMFLTEEMFSKCK